MRERKEEQTGKQPGAKRERKGEIQPEKIMLAQIMVDLRWHIPAVC